MSSAAPPPARRSRAARGERAKLAGSEGNGAGHGRARLRRPARPWHRPDHGTGFATRFARGLHIMIIDRETFSELAVHLKLASVATLKTARHRTGLSTGDSSNGEQWA